MALAETLSSLVTSQRAILYSHMFSAKLSERWEAQTAETMQGSSFWVVQYEATDGTSSLSENISGEICMMWEVYTNTHTTAVRSQRQVAEHAFKLSSEVDVKTCISHPHRPVFVR